MKVWGKLGTHFGKVAKLAIKSSQGGIAKFDGRLCLLLWTASKTKGKRKKEKKGRNLKILFQEMGMVDLGANERNWHYWV